ncbi:MAG TPA: hypothetical protein VD837_13365 [Terriglobales bacterium]|nr:hypothetical protein [Terriglobales bacterium]
MKIVDQLFGWVLVILGLVWTAFTFRAHGLGGISVYAPGAMIVLAGLVNVARAGSSSGMLRFASVFANLFVLSLSLANAFSMASVLRQNPQAPILVVAAVIETIFSIWG